MPCYRVAFQNNSIFEVIVDFGEVEGTPHRQICTGLMYRLTNNVRENKALHRVDGTELRIVAPTNAMALDIARQVLTIVTGSAVAMVSGCGSSQPPTGHKPPRGYGDV
jgi:hypothetical protein